MCVGCKVPTHCSTFPLCCVLQHLFNVCHPFSALLSLVCSCSVQPVRCSCVQCAARGGRLGAVAGECRTGHRVHCTSAAAAAADQCVDCRPTALQQPESTQRRLQLRPREAAGWMGLLLLLLPMPLPKCIWVKPRRLSAWNITRFVLCVLSACVLAIDLNSHWLQVKRGQRELGRHLLPAKNCIWVKTLQHSTASTINTMHCIAMGGNII